MAEEDLLDLPNELWIEIMANEQLSYHDLKRVAGVCKRFKALCQARPSLPRCHRG